MTSDRTRLELPQGRARQWLNRALAMFMGDLSQGHRTQFYHDVLRLDVVSTAGQTSQSYGMGWDHQLSPMWQYPPTDAVAQFNGRDVAKQDDSAPTGLAVPRSLSQARAMPRALRGKAA